MISETNMVIFNVICMKSLKIQKGHRVFEEWLSEMVSTTTKSFFYSLSVLSEVAVKNRYEKVS